METPNRTSTDTAISVIGAIFGTAHFVFQTAADLTAHAEGKLVEKVSKGAITRQQTVDNRRAITKTRQTDVKVKYYEMKARIAAKQQQPATV